MRKIISFLNENKINTIVLLATFVLILSSLFYSSIDNPKGVLAATDPPPTLCKLVAPGYPPDPGCYAGADCNNQCTGGMVCTPSPIVCPAGQTNTCPFFCEEPEPVCTLEVSGTPSPSASFVSPNFTLNVDPTTAPGTPVDTDSYEIKVVEGVHTAGEIDGLPAIASGSASVGTDSWTHFFPVSPGTVTVAVRAAGDCDGEGVTSEWGIASPIVPPAPEEEPPPEEPDPGLPICGFAWAGINDGDTNYGGAGWISFNRRDCDTNNDGLSDGVPAGCPAAGTSIPEYGVNLTNDNRLSGYAWSNNIGWIKFGGVGSGMPSGIPNTPGGQARVLGNGNVVGWARACAGTVNGICTGASRTDGWDGWLNLKGASYGVQKTGTKFSGYAWGSTVLGWMNWNPIEGSGVKMCTEPTMFVSLSANPPSGNITFNSTLAAEVQGTILNEAGDYTYRYACKAGDAWSRPYISANPTHTYPTQCEYNTEGAHVARVEVTKAGITTVVTTTINANDPNNNGDPEGGNLSVQCSAVPGDYYVNDIITWRADVVAPDTGTPPYSYEWSFDPDPSFEEQNGNLVNTRYSTIGTKEAIVTVSDAGTPVPATSQPCSVKVNVKVKPSFIEI